MSIEITAIRRVFEYQGMQLPDLGDEYTVSEVKDFHSAVYGELTTAEIVDLGIEGDVHRYEFRKAVGAKG